jgi:hypothetical protein
MPSKQTVFASGKKAALKSLCYRDFYLCITQRPDNPYNLLASRRIYKFVKSKLIVYFFIWI